MKNFFYVAVLILLASCENDEKRTTGLCLSFDDRTVREWFEMSNLLDKYDAKVTFFVSRIDSLTPQEIHMLRELEKKGHEIGSHGALHVNSEFYIRENSYKEYLKNEIDQSILSMNKKKFYPVSFSYPYGAKYWLTDYFLLKRFKILRGVVGIEKDKNIYDLDKIYYNRGVQKVVYALGIDANSGLTKKMISDGIKRAADKNEILLLYGHAPGKDTASIRPYEFSMDQLEFILMNAKKNKLTFYRIRDLTD